LGDCQPRTTKKIHSTTTEIVEANAPHLVLRFQKIAATTTGSRAAKPVKHQTPSLKRLRSITSESRNVTTRMPTVNSRPTVICWRSLIRSLKP
jgi:hypothetical protein